MSTALWSLCAGFGGAVLVPAVCIQPGEVDLGQVTVCSIGLDFEKATFAAPEIQVLLLLPRVAAAQGVFAVDRATAELEQPGHRVLRSVLPVPVATDHEEVFEPGKELTNFVTFGLVGCVGQAVGFSDLVGAY